MILVGIVALIFLGPRKLPEMARKAGKILSEFRGTANEFKETWQREVNFEEEAKALDINAIEADPVKRVDSIPISETSGSPVEPLIKEVDPASFEHLVQADSTDKQKPAREQGRDTQLEEQPNLPLETTNPSDKINWL